MLQLLLIVIGMVGLVAFVYLHRTFISIWSEYRVELFAYGALGLLSLAGLGYLLRRWGILGALFSSRLFRAIAQAQVLRSGPGQAQGIWSAAFRLEVQLYALLGNTDEARSGDGAGAASGCSLVPPLRQPDGRAIRRRHTGEAPRDSTLPAHDLGFLGGRKRHPPTVPGVGQGVVGTREAAALWHVPGDAVDVAGLCARGQQAAARAAGDVRTGGGKRQDGAALIGVEAYGDGGLRKLHIPPEAMRRSGLIVARTGMGKTTLTQHIARSLLRDRATGIGRRRSRSRGSALGPGAGHPQWLACGRRHGRAPGRPG